jgi:cation diffusion facilitator family transporter
MAKSSRRVVLAALAGNGAIALAKFAAAGISGSTAMLTEAIHSLVDTADQVLLLVGQTRGERPADATHPLGHGMEVYFWSFIVALMVFLVGGVLSMYEGVRQILNPAPVISPGISLTVLAVAAAFEGTSFRIAYREYQGIERPRPVRRVADDFWWEAVALKRYRSHPIMLIGDEPQSYPSYRDIAIKRK